MAVLFFKLAASAWCLALIAQDCRTGKVANWLTMPVIVGSLIYWLRLGLPLESWGIMLAAWILSLASWSVGIIGGGSAKVNIAMFTMFPTIPFLLIHSVVALMASFVIVAGSGEMEIKRPNEEYLEEVGKRAIWIFASSPIVYVWLML